jgi:hypothetical protein
MPSHSTLSAAYRLRVVQGLFVIMATLLAAWGTPSTDSGPEAPFYNVPAETRIT